jgi:hypothetical protein
MRDVDAIKLVSKEKADELYESFVVCAYCKTPFKECDTIIPGKGLVIGETDVKEYRNSFWHSGCILDYQQEYKYNGRYYLS